MEPAHRINVIELVTAIKETAMRLREAKRAYNTPNRPDWKVWTEIPSLKRRATELCATRAHLRGRVHLRGKTREEQAESIAPCLAEFGLASFLTAA